MAGSTDLDHCNAIARRLGCYAFPWDITRALELALFRTFASPAIASLLHRTGEFERAARKRYDDTDLIVSLIVENGVGSPLACEAIARMNAIHGRFRIANEDFLYVLSTFAIEPLRWIDRFGWRALTDEERMGWFGFWRQVGLAMGIADIPETLLALEALSEHYEATRFRPNPASAAVAHATCRMFAEPAPLPFRPLVQAGISSLLDDRLRTAVGFRRAPVMALLMPGIMGLRALALRLLPKRTRPRLRTGIARAKSYPSGWSIERLGPSEGAP